MTTDEIRDVAAGLARLARRHLPDDMDIGVRITATAWSLLAPRSCEDGAPTFETTIILWSRKRPEIGAVTRKLTAGQPFEGSVRALTHVLWRRIRKMDERAARRAAA